MSFIYCVCCMSEITQVYRSEINRLFESYLVNFTKHPTLLPSLWTLCMYVCDLQYGFFFFNNNKSQFLSIFNQIYDMHTFSSFWLLFFIDKNCFQIFFTELQTELLVQWKAIANEIVFGLNKKKQLFKTTMKNIKI